MGHRGLLNMSQEEPCKIIMHSQRYSHKRKDALRAVASVGKRKKGSGNARSLSSAGLSKFFSLKHVFRTWRIVLNIWAAPG